MPNLTPKVILEGTRLIGESILPVHELDISHGDIARGADAIADWLERTGGLWSP
jgi:hypothetical protein